MDLLWLAIGGGLLFFGADWLVEGAAGSAVRLGVRPLLIGLTIVSYATSAPELAVSVSASLKGQGALVLGNVLGSNITNIALILGLTALIAPPKNDGSMAHKELWVLLASTAVPILFLMDNQLQRYEGLLLVAGSFAFTVLTIRWSKSRPPDLEEIPTEESRSLGMLAGIGLLGLAALIGGGELFVRGAVGIAEVLGIDERIIGLTVVAFGTSVPELAASAVAAAKGHSDLAIGNVVGSKIFNALLILGSAAGLRPFSAHFENMGVDLGFLGVLSVYVVIALWRPRRLTRIEGGLLSLSYVGFVTLLVCQIP